MGPLENQPPSQPVAGKEISIEVGKEKQKVTLDPNNGTWEIDGKVRNIYYGGKAVGSIENAHIREKVIQIVAKALTKLKDQVDPNNLETMKITNKKIEYQPLNGAKNQGPKDAGQTIQRLFNELATLPFKKQEVQRNESKELSRDHFDPRNQGLFIIKGTNSNSIPPSSTNQSTVSVHKKPKPSVTSKDTTSIQLQETTKDKNNSEKSTVEKEIKYKTNAQSTNPTDVNTNVSRNEDQIKNDIDTDELTVKEEIKKKPEIPNHTTNFKNNLETSEDEFSEE